YRPGSDLSVAAGPTDKIGVLPARVNPEATTPGPALQEWRKPRRAVSRSTPRLGLVRQRDAAIVRPRHRCARNRVAAQRSLGHFLPRRQSNDRIAAKRSIQPKRRFGRHSRDGLNGGLCHRRRELAIELFEHGFDIDTHWHPSSYPRSVADR